MHHVNSNRRHPPPLLQPGRLPGLLSWTIWYRPHKKQDIHASLKYLGRPSLLPSGMASFAVGDLVSRPEPEPAPASAFKVAASPGFRACFSHSLTKTFNSLFASPYRSTKIGEGVVYKTLEKLSFFFFFDVANPKRGYLGQMKD